MRTICIMAMMAAKMAATLSRRSVNGPTLHLVRHAQEVHYTLKKSRDKRPVHDTVVVIGSHRLAGGVALCSLVQAFASLYHA